MIPFALLKKSSPQGQTNGKKGLKMGSFCFITPLSQSKPSRMLKLLDIRSIAVGRNKTKIIVVSLVP